MTAPEQTRVRISTPEQILATIPWLVGFHPTDSVVVLCLHEPRGRIGLTMRLDAPPPEHSAVFAEQVAARAEHARAGAVIVAGYGAVIPTLYALGDAMEMVGIEVRELLHVQDGRWRSLYCSDSACCPPEGQPVPPIESSPYAAPSIAGGTQVLATREDLVNSVRPVCGIARVSIEQATDRVSESIAGRLETGGRDDVRAETVALFAAAVTRFGDPRTRLTDDEAGRLNLGLFDVAARDEVLRLAVSEQADAFYALLRYLVRRAVPPDDTPACTALAIAAYLHGDGALALTALERALASDPDYSFAQLILESLNRQVPPRELRRVFTASVGTREGSRRSHPRGAPVRRPRRGA